MENVKNDSPAGTARRVNDSGSVQCLVKTEIAHDRGYNRIARQLTLALQILGADVHDLVTVHFIAVLIHSQAPVGITVKSETNVQFILFHIFLQGLNMCTAAVPVNVQAVRFIVYNIGFCAQRVEYRGTYHPAAAV